MFGLTVKLKRRTIHLKFSLFTRFFYGVLGILFMGGVYFLFAARQLLGEIFTALSCLSTLSLDALSASTIRLNVFSTKKPPFVIKDRYLQLIYICVLYH